MGCYHPLYAQVIQGQTSVNGKRVLKILGSHISEDRLLNDPNIVSLPCGKCIGCRLDYSRQWAGRLMLELQYHDSAYFVTLTYNDEFVPRSVYGVSDETGECRESFTLNKRDVQLFFKRLRKAFPDDKIRYFCSGEYGPSTFRPHYHAIIFGLHLDDLVWCGKSELGFNYYSSYKLKRCWAQKAEGDEHLDLRLEDPEGEILSPYISMGFVSVADVTWETCAYTARYVTKKLTGEEAEFYENFSLVPPFSLMSRKPGIARQWYEDHPDFTEYKYINIPGKDTGRKVLPPRYFEKLLGEDRPELAVQRAELRSAAARMSIKAKLAETSLSYQQVLETAEDIKLSRTKKLIRRDL